MQASYCSFITDDKAFNDHTIEDVMRETGIELLPLRKWQLPHSQDRISHWKFGRTFIPKILCRHG